MKLETAFTTKTCDVKLLPTRGAMAMEMDDWVKLRPPSVTAGKEYEKEILIGMENTKGEFVAAASAKFKYVPDDMAQKLEESVRDAVKEPWFQGRLGNVSTDIAFGLPDEGDNHRIFYEEVRDMVQRLSFIGEQFIRDKVRDALEQQAIEESKDKSGGLKLKEDVIEHDHTAESEGNGRWTCEHNVQLMDGSSITVKDVYGNFKDAVDKLRAQFREDYDRYGKLLSVEDRVEVRKAFKRTLERQDILHPHYRFKGSHYDPKGVKRTFNVKAEVYGERVLNKDNGNSAKVKPFRYKLVKRTEENACER